LSGQELVIEFRFTLDEQEDTRFLLAMHLPAGPSGGGSMSAGPWRWREHAGHHDPAIPDFHSIKGRRRQLRALGSAQPAMDALEKGLLKQRRVAITDCRRCRAGGCVADRTGSEFRVTDIDPYHVWHGVAVDGWFWRALEAKIRRRN